jgi:hypothetical protein
LTISEQKTAGHKEETERKKERKREERSDVKKKKGKQ